jgi:hypothetical protein
MKNHRTHIIAGIFFLLLFSFHLRATVHTYNATIDISSPWNVSNSGGQWNYLWIFSGAPTFTVQSGDTVQGTISFTGNQALQFQGPVNAGSISWTWTDFGNATPNSTQSTTTLNGIAGQLNWPNPTATSSTSPGSYLEVGNAQVWTPTAVSFTGFSYSATVLSGSGSYTPYFLSAYSPNGAQQGAISVIPEPSAMGLIGIGIILLLLIKKRLKKSLEPTVGAGSSAVHAASRRWLLSGCNV